MTRGAQREPAATPRLRRRSCTIQQYARERQGAAAGGQATVEATSTHPSYAFTSSKAILLRTSTRSTKPI